MQPVRLQRIVLAAEHDADIGGVLFRGVKIRIAGTAIGRCSPRRAIGTNAQLAQLVIVAQFRIVVRSSSLIRARVATTPSARAP